MNITPILACAVLACAATVVAADGPAGIAAVKTLVVRDVSPPGPPPLPTLNQQANWTNSARVNCIVALETSLSAAGFTIQDQGKPDGADAELAVTMTFAPTAKENEDQSGGAVLLNYSVRIQSLPGKAPLLSFADQASGTLSDVGDSLAKKTVKKIQDAQGAQAQN